MIENRNRKRVNVNDRNLNIMTARAKLEKAQSDKYRNLAKYESIKRRKEPEHKIKVRDIMKKEPKYTIHLNNKVGEYKPIFFK